MSSSIQCLSHAIGLTNYFLFGFFKSELNYKNPLGAQGQLAIAYAKLLKQLWYDDKPNFAPWQFKRTIGKFAKAVNNKNKISYSSTIMISKTHKSYLIFCQMACMKILTEFKKNQQFLRLNQRGLMMKKTLKNLGKII